MSIDFKEIVLHNYGGFKLKADIDENPEDIIAAVCYCDHGDDFLVVKTKDAVYEYGLYVTRNGWDARCLDDETHHSRQYFLKMPKLTGKFDYRSEMENKIYFYLDGELTEKGGFLQPDKIRVYHSRDYAQLSFNKICEKLKEFYDTGVVYHCRVSSHVSDIMRYLEANDILTDENLQRLEDIRTYLREDTIDGTAGKRDMTNRGYFCGDDLNCIYYNGEKVIKKYHKHKIKVKSTWTDDEWGPERGFCVDMDQFK